MTALREQRRGGSGHTDTKGNSHYLFLTQTRTHTCEGGKVDLVEDFSSSHTSKHRTEGQEGRGGTIGRPGDGAQGPLGLHRHFSKQRVKDKHLEEKFSR